MSLNNKLAGLQPDLIPYAEASLQLMQLVTGGKQDVKGRVTGGVTPTVTSGFRSIADQERLYKARATNPYPVNRPGDSAHNYGLAFDSDVPDEWQPLWREVREYVGFRVPDNDEVHAEVPNWRDLISR